MNIGKIVEKQECIGCAACSSICPVSAIRIIVDKKGFYNFEVNDNVCIECEACLSVCPVLGEIVREEANVKAYAAWSKRQHVRINSSSGGMFFEIADYVIRRINGAVYGVLFDDKYYAKYKRVDSENLSELNNLRGSKYIQASMEDIYYQLERDIKNAIIIFYVGLPCQLAAIKKYIGYKKLNTDSIIMADLICHGVASLAIYKMWIDYIGRNRKVKKLLFRDKKNGWKNFSIRIEFWNGDTIIRKHRNDPFFFGYLKNLYLNNECYSCRFSGFPRQGDITLGDFWGAPKEIDDDKGISLVLINNIKAKFLFDQLENIEFKEIDLNYAISKNPMIAVRNINIPKDRYLIFSKLLNGKLNYRDLQYLAIKYKIFECIKRVIRRLINLLPVI